MSESTTFKKFNYHFFKKSTAVPNNMIFHSELKDSSFRLLCALDALPESNWKTNQTWLAKQLGWGREKVAAAIADLEEHGYLRRTQHRENGRFAHYSYEFHWEPIFKDNPNIQEDKYPGQDDGPDDGDSGSGSGGGKPVGCDDGGKPVPEESSTTRYIDRLGSNNTNNSIIEPPTPKCEKREKETGSVGGLQKESKIYQCLQKVDILEKDKIRLSSQFSEEIVSKSVAHCTKPNFKVQISLDSSIFYFCRQPDHIVKTKEDIIAEKLKLEDEQRDREWKHKQMASQAIKYFWTKARELGVYLRDCSDYMEISNDRIQEKVYYSNDKFMVLMGHLLKKVGLEKPIEART